MYKLENNVEWTNELKNQFKHGTVYAQLDFGDGNILGYIFTESFEELLCENGDNLCYDIKLTQENVIKSITLTDSRYVPDVGFIGQAVSRMLKVELLDVNKELNLENKECTLKLGVKLNEQIYYINYGKFIVNESPETDETNDNISITCYDYMIKFNKDYVDRIEYPCTLKQLLQDICNQAGVELGTTNFVNQNFIVENNQFSNKTLREVLQNISKCAFSWSRIGQDNKLYIDYSNGTEVAETLTMNEYKQDSYKKANEYYGAINKVTFGDSNIQGQEESIEDLDDIILNGTKELVIKDNLFAYTESKRKALIQGGNVLFGMKYMPIQQLDMIGLAYLDCNDIIEVEDMQGDKIQTRVFSHTIEYNGAISDKIENSAISENQQTYENKTTTAKTTERIGITVDRATKNIESIVSEIGDRSQKSTTITQDIDGINSTVSKMETVTNYVEGRGVIELDNAIDLPIYRFTIRGYKQYNNYLYCDESFAGDDSVGG